MYVAHHRPSALSVSPTIVPGMQVSLIIFFVSVLLIYLVFINNLTIQWSLVREAASVLLILFFHVLSMLFFSEEEW